MSDPTQPSYNDFHKAYLKRALAQLADVEDFKQKYPNVKLAKLIPSPVAGEGYYPHIAINTDLEELYEAMYSNPSYSLKSIGRGVAPHFLNNGGVTLNRFDPRLLGSGARDKQGFVYIKTKDEVELKKLLADEYFINKLREFSPYKLPDTLGYEDLKKLQNVYQRDLPVGEGSISQSTGNKKLAALGLGAVGLMGLIAAMNQKDPKEELQKKQIVEDMKRKREQMGYYQ